MVARSTVRRNLIIVGSVAALLCLLPYGWIQWARNVGEREYRAELELARKEGIPTTPDEFAALIPRAEPDENAALHYAKLEGVSFDISRCTTLQFHLVRKPTKEWLDLTKKFLDSQQTAFEHLDAATSLDKCWFEADAATAGLTKSARAPWASYAAPLLMLRGTSKMLKGDAAGAIGDADRIAKMADHFGQVPTPWRQGIRNNLESKALEALADWCFARRGDKRYVDAFRQRIDRFEQDAVKRPVAKAWVVNGAYILDRVWTGGGRKELGLKETTIQQNISLALSPADTSANIMRGLRELTRAAVLPEPKRSAEMVAARKRVKDAARPLDGFVNFMPPELDDSGELFADVRNFYRVLARAFEHQEIPRSLDVSDLAGPGRALDYSFDGVDIKVGSRRFVVQGESP